MTNNSTLRLIFDDCAHTYVLKSSSNDSPSMRVMPTLRLNLSRCQDSATSEGYPIDHPLYGRTPRAYMQIIPAIVSHFHYPHSYHASSSSSSNIAQIGDGSGPVQVAIKWARGSESIRTLEQEYEVYEETLKPLQGSVVPICYGLFAGRVEGEYVACLVLEWCGGVRKVDDIELIRQKMVGAVKLHKAGIQHNGLFKPQHYLFTTSTNQLRIIDFSQATSHVCPDSMPRIRNLSNGLPPDGCGELDALEALFTDGVVLDEEEEGRESVWDCFAQ